MADAAHAAELVSESRKAATNSTAGSNSTPPRASGYTAAGVSELEPFCALAADGLTRTPPLVAPPADLPGG
jgi:hypothetical protein